VNQGVRVRFLLDDYMGRTLVDVIMAAVPCEGDRVQLPNDDFKLRTVVKPPMHAVFPPATHHVYVCLDGGEYNPKRAPESEPDDG